VTDDSAGFESPPWFDAFQASYRYLYPWAMLVFPGLGLLGISTAWFGAHSMPATLAALGAEVVFVLVCIEYRTYYIRIEKGQLVRGSWFHSKSIPLGDIDLVQVVRGKGKCLFLWRNGRVVLKTNEDLDGFEDLIGFFREYARHHHVPFKGRDRYGEWS
jgi:hypothetical protein